LDAAPLDLNNFLSLFNKNLPQDIKALSVEETTAEFNIINHAKIKEYVYLFSFGEKTHPFCASLMVNFEERLDIALMNKGAQLFEGTHNFRNFCYKPTENTITTGTIKHCRITENTQYTANFFPKKSYVLTVIGGGFKRNQIRIMMARLVQLGRGEYTFREIQEAINLPNIECPISYIAPASGLILNRVILKNDPV
jgi:tRNA pseudouridine38-40 synthase